MDLERFPLFSKLVDLTLAIYRVTSSFPAAEPLREQIRSKANLILAHAIKIFHSTKPSSEHRTQLESEDDFFSEIDILRGYFLVARSQHWVKEINFEILDTAYKGIKYEFKECAANMAREKKEIEGSKIRPPGVDKSQKKEYNMPNLPERQKKIFEYISKNGNTQASDLEPVFFGTNIRTIRRDLDGLERAGLVDKEMRGRQAFYFTKKVSTA